MAQKVGRYINPVLAALQQLGGSGRPAEVCAEVVRAMNLSGGILEETQKDGRPKFENLIAWVRLYLAETGYIDRTKRGIWTLTEKGKAAGPLTEKQVQALLLQVQRGGQRDRHAVEMQAVTRVSEENSAEEATSPDEEPYASALLTLLRGLPPAGFERLCQRLLRESGFEQVEVTGKSGDGGIDGIGVLKVNPFVAFKVLFQCKRYSGTVGAGQVRDFRGAMLGRADKGIILTTGGFSADAHKEAVRDGVPPLELVDGEQLVSLCEQLEFGLIPRTTYDIDPQFFDQFRS